MEKAVNLKKAARSVENIEAFRKEDERAGRNLKEIGRSTMYGRPLIYYQDDSGGFWYKSFPCPEMDEAVRKREQEKLGKRGIDMTEARIFTMSTWKSPRETEGIAIWLLETRNGQETITNNGFIHDEHSTERRGTIKAIINALHVLKKSAPQVKHVSIFTECAWIAGTLESGCLEKWKAAGWKTSRGETVKNAELWQMLANYLEPYTADFGSIEHEYGRFMDERLMGEAIRCQGEEKERNAGTCS